MSRKKVVVFGIFSTRVAVENAADTLVKGGFPSSDFSLLLGRKKLTQTLGRGSLFRGFLFFLKTIFGLQKVLNSQGRLTMTRDDVTGTIFTFVLGVGVGAIAALLLAPKSGERLRGEIADGVNDGLDAIRSTGKDLKRRGQKLVELAKDQVQEAIETGEQAYIHAKKP